MHRPLAAHRSPILPCCFALLTIAALARATPPAAPDSARQQMAQLSFLIGHWEGDGWIDVAPGQRRAFHETEVVTGKLDELILTIEGRGVGEHDAVVHDAFAVLSWDAGGQVYRFASYETSGRVLEAQGRLTNGAFVWGFPAGPGREIRFTIRLDEQGRWAETGEMLPAAGAPQKFFEMRLVKRP